MNLIFYKHLLEPTKEI